jgi:dTDP-4-dehydrorhamnose 3,5-epimerase
LIVQELGISGILLLKPVVHRDARGCFLETWRDDRYSAAGLPELFVQDNVSISSERVLRGLHFQHPRGQGKLLSAVAGEVFDVAVDVRVGSPTFGKSVNATLSGLNGWQLYIPPGFAHGFLTLSREAVVTYKCTTHYAPEFEQGVRWDDPTLGIQWPSKNPLLSQKDMEAPLLSEIPPSRLPAYRCENARNGRT